ncbi:DegV family protein [Litchfieldia salsa]|uniref:EDD domain protein, DegV family n=1 Tax=Litchfieldia salsa TaxID=930152 RepID=A0A1H0UMW6_9BACI|nr:DegV family protein [Litchfieldia salsa]SDP67529.1 EDD domain protein, DegV family [Litchfieldia salsa]
MTKKIAWVTDSTATFTKDEQQWLTDNHVYVIPLTVIFGEEQFREGIEITTEEFYKKMSESNVSPSTSQPTLGDFIELYTHLKEHYDEAVAIHVSGELSGTYSTSVQAADMVGFPIHSFDSWIGSFPLKMIVKTGIELYKRGIDIPDILIHLTNLRDKCKLMLLPASLEQLRKSGRVSNFGSFIGNLLQIKPILSFKEGKVHMIEKVRSYSKAENTIIDKFHQSFETGILEEVAVLYAGEKSVADKVVQRMKDKYQELKIEIVPLIPVAGVHTGIGTVGLAWIEK